MASAVADKNAGKTALQTEGLTRSNLLCYPPEEIIAPPENNKARAFPHTEAEIIKRAISIVNVGQLEPCTVRKVGDNRPVLVFGFLRHAGIALANKWALDPSSVPDWVKAQFFPDKKPVWKKVACIKKDMNDEEALIAAIIENSERKAASHMDNAKAHRSLREDYGYNNARIAATCDLSETWVGKLQKLLNLSLEEQVLVDTGQLPIEVAEKLAEVTDAAERKAAIKANMKPVPVPEGHLPFGPLNGDGSKAEAPEVKLDAKGLKETLRTKKAEKTGKGISRTLSEVRQIFEELASVSEDAEVEDPDLAPFAKSVIELFSGSKGKQALCNALKRYGDAKVAAFKADLKAKAEKAGK